MIMTPWGCCFTGFLMVFGYIGVFTPGTPTPSQYLALGLLFHVMSLAVTVILLLVSRKLKGFLYERLGEEYVTSRVGKNPAQPLFRFLIIQLGGMAIEGGASMGNLANEKALLEINKETVSILFQEETKLFSEETKLLSSEKQNMELSEEALEKAFDRHGKNAIRILTVSDQIREDVAKSTIDYMPPLSRLATNWRS